MKAPKISISIGADTKKLKRDMKNADGIIGKFTTAAKYGLASAAAAAGAFAFKIGKDGVQAALEDEKSQVRLQRALDNTTKATDAQIASVEDYISKTQLRYGIEDVALRSSLAKLATVTGSVTKAQKLQNIALDVAAGAGISLEQATTLVTKAQQGSFTAFKKLGIVLGDNIIKSKDGAKAVEILGQKYQGAAAAAADTTQGKLDRLQQAWNETVESVGYALLPALEDLADWATSPEGAKALQDFVDTFSQAIKDIPGYVDDIGKALDAIVPDPNSPMWEFLKLITTFSPASLAMSGANTGPNRTKTIPWSPTNMPNLGFPKQTPATVNITINGALDPQATGKTIKQILNQTQLNAISPNAGDRRR